MPLEIACTNEEQVPVTVVPLTPGGKPAQLDGPLQVEVLSGDGTVVQDAATPNIFKARSGDALGDTVYQVTGDADLGEGVVPLVDTVTLTVGSATAVSLGLTAGVPEPKE